MLTIERQDVCICLGGGHETDGAVVRAVQWVFAASLAGPDEPHMLFQVPFLRVSQ